LLIQEKHYNLLNRQNIEKLYTQHQIYNKCNTLLGATEREIGKHFKQKLNNNNKSIITEAGNRKPIIVTCYAEHKNTVDETVNKSNVP
jgi:selenophosphate synthase